MVEAEHDHVVLIYSAELEGGQPVIRMEYLPDGSVEHKYGGAPAPVLTAVRIMEDACRGIEHLHVRGILHRDIKPGNLLLTPTGSVKGQRLRTILPDHGRERRAADRVPTAPATRSSKSGHWDRHACGRCLCSRRHCVPAP